MGKPFDQGLRCPPLFPPPARTRLLGCHQPLCLGYGSPKDTEYRGTCPSLIRGKGFLVLSSYFSFLPPAPYLKPPRRRTWPSRSSDRACRRCSRDCGFDVGSWEALSSARAARVPPLRSSAAVPARESTEGYPGDCGRVVQSPSGAKAQGGP